MDVETIKTTAIWLLIGVAVVGILAAILIRKVVGKIISLALAAVLVFFFWQQRDTMLEKAEDIKGQSCAAANEHLPSFFGFEIPLPDGWCVKK